MSDDKKPGAGRGSSGRGQRDLRVRVKSAKGRKLSSTLWLERQLNDPYVARAKREGYRGRAAFKILELDDKYRFLVPGARVVDLGEVDGVARDGGVFGRDQAPERVGLKVGILERAIAEEELVGVGHGIRLRRDVGSTEGG